MKHVGRAPEIDISELESLFSAASTSDGSSLERISGRRGSNINKPEKVQLVNDTFLFLINVNHYLFSLASFTI